MKVRSLPAILALHTILFATSLAVLYKAPTQALSATATTVVISEVQIGNADDADNEFVELYNPTASSVDLTDWRLTRKSGGGSQSNLVESLSGSIPAHGYYLVANPAYTTIPTAPNVTYSASSSAITGSSTIVLYSDAGTTVVDKVGFGAVVDFEGTPLATATADMSYERKASSTSTPESMSGSEATSGNGEDTNTNANDFVTRSAPQPQNTSSTIEIPSGATPTPTPTPSPSATPPASPTPSPTVEPTPVVSPTPVSSPSPTPATTPTPSPSASPSPTVEPSPTPVASPSPTVNPSPSATPTSTPTPSASPSPTVAPSPSASASPTPTVTPSPSPSKPPFFSGFLFSCSVRYIPVRFGFSTFQFPVIRCTFR